uniref:hypothetical protein n=1 Tax=Candidatus Electrothrix sp. TaxID=2170559 RepID=UPI0040577776
MLTEKKVLNQRVSWTAMACIILPSTEIELRLQLMFGKVIRTNAKLGLTELVDGAISNQDIEAWGKNQYNIKILKGAE